MEAMVTGWERMHGKGKKTGSAYDFGTVHVLNGLAPIDLADTKRECGGYKTAPLGLTESGIRDFAKLNGQSYPVRMLLKIENQIKFDGNKEGLVGVVVGAEVLRPSAK